MEQSSTLLKKKKSVRRFSPRKVIIDNILNYSRTMSLIGSTMVVINN